jgi:alpha-tubulin suppressor-like RCC1 family protein
LTSGVTAISMGFHFACAIQNGAAKCWGYNGYGQLGINNTINQHSPVQVTGLTSGVTAISAGKNHACAIQNGAAKCWGSNTYKESGIPATGNQLTPVQVVV